MSFFPPTADSEIAGVYLPQWGTLLKPMACLSGGSTEFLCHTHTGHLVAFTDFNCRSVWRIIRSQRCQLSSNLVTVYTVIRVNCSMSNLFANHHIALFSWTNLHKGGPTGSPRSSSDLAQTSSSFSNMLGIPSWRFHSAGPWMSLDVPGHSTWVRVASEEPNITQSLSC